MALAGWPAGSGNLGSAGEWNDVVESCEMYYIIEYDNQPTDDWGDLNMDGAVNILDVIFLVNFIIGL